RLCAGLPAHGRGTALRRAAAAEEGSPHRNAGALMAPSLNELGEHIAQATAPAVTAWQLRLGGLMLETTPGDLLNLLAFLRDDPRCLFKQLCDVSGVDWPDREKRFDVVYNLLSLKNNQRVRVKVATDETTPVPSAASLFSSAGWF